MSDSARPFGSSITSMSSSEPLSLESTHLLPTSDSSTTSSDEFSTAFDSEPIIRDNSRSWAIAGSASVYWTTVSLIPVYNKFFFRKDLYPFPIATAGIQLAAVSLLLGFLDTLHHFYFEQFQHHDLLPQRTPSLLFASRTCPHAESRTVSSSWIFGPHIWFKIKWCFPIGVLFGLKYGVTNWGLHLVPAPTHLLLQSTDLVWTVLGAWWINQERVKPVEFLCLMLCILGSVVLSLNHITHDATTKIRSDAKESNHIVENPGSSAPIADLNWETSNLFAIGINLLSPLLLGLCIATLRLACTELMRPDNCLGGRVGSVELTCLKLLMSSAVATFLAMLVEPDWYRSFVSLDSSTRGGVLFGALLIAVFQVNCTLLTHLTNTVSVGLVGQVKIIPQWIVATIFATAVSKDFCLQLQNEIGAILIIASAAAYCWSNCDQQKYDSKELEVLGRFDRDRDYTEDHDDETSTKPHNDGNVSFKPQIDGCRGKGRPFANKNKPLLLAQRSGTVAKGYL